MTHALLCLNGPNLNLLGTREPHIYGAHSLTDIEYAMQQHAKSRGASVHFMQSNHEGALVDALQQAPQAFAAVILNAAAYTHTSVALHDAVKAITPLPVIELHLSNPHAREAFRHQSYLSPVVRGVISGFGAKGYLLAVEAAVSLLNEGRA